MIEEKLVIIPESVYKPEREPQKRDDDVIVDDKAKLVRIKEYYLFVQHWAVKYMQPEDAYNAAVYAEQAFDDMILPQWNELCTADGSDDKLPQSIYLDRWEKESREKK